MTVHPKYGQHIYNALCIGECPSNSPFLKDIGAEAPKGPRPIVFKEWRDTLFVLLRSHKGQTI
jgi:hypothetical protein